MTHYSTGEVRKLFVPPLPESRIWSRIRAGQIEPQRRVAGRYLWTKAEVARLAVLLGLPVPQLPAMLGIGGVQ